MNFVCSVFASEVEWLMMLAMPTVLRQNGFAVMIPVDDHPPPHVHVKKGGNELIVNLGDERSKASVRKNRGMSKSELAQVLRIINTNQKQLLAGWRKLHG